IRVALGAAHTDVVRMVVFDALRLAAWGVAIGLCVAPAAIHFARAFLFGVAATDVSPLIVVATVVTAIAALAAAIPGHRAARTASDRACSPPCRAPAPTRAPARAASSVRRLRCRGAFRNPPARVRRSAAGSSRDTSWGRRARAEARAAPAS